MDSLSVQTRPACPILLRGVVWPPLSSGSVPRLNDLLRFREGEAGLMTIGPYQRQTPVVIMRIFFVRSAWLIVRSLRSRRGV
jgi:hypothetical protein